MSISVDDTATASAALQEARARIAELEAALSRSRTVGMALGIIVERGKVTPENAIDVLRELSSERGSSMDDVAAGIVAGDIGVEG